MDTTVAVMNFVNYGGPGLDYLSESIPDSISSYISDIEGIRVLERSELDEFLDDVILKQSGSFDTKDVERVGNLANAEVLILGYISGNPDDVIINMKAVRVSTGDVVTEKVVHAPMATLFDRAVIAGSSIGVVVSGRNVARVSIFTVPSGATVYIDGTEVGRTPLREYEVVPGEHRVLLVLKGYVDYERTVTVSANAHEQLNSNLKPDQKIRLNEIGFSFHYLVPLHHEVEPTLLINPIFYARKVGVLQPGFEFAFALNQRHDMELTSPLNTPFTMERQYNLIMFHAFINVLPFQKWRYVAPYFGVAVGLVHLKDFRINQAFEDNEELIISQTNLSIMGKIGVNFFTISFLRFFIEARFYLLPSTVDRPTYVSQGLGSEMAQVSKETHLNYYSVGGGVKFAF
jgi:TolB-like protein